MAGLGFKTWVRERLTAAQFQGYVQDQVVARAASASAYAAQNPSPAEGMHRYLDDSNRLEFHTGAAWVPRGARGLTRTHVPVANTVPASTARESGVADGPPIAGFTVHQTTSALAVARFRASCPNGGYLYAAIKVDGAVIGNALIRSALDEDHIVIGFATNLAIGAHTLSLRVEATAAQVSWIDSTVSLYLGSPE